MNYINVFKKEYERLNFAQKEAVDSISGPVMVVAGPGTGKTQIIALRIANILLKTDADPSSILALTFTESGVKAMRERLTEIIGPVAYYIHISTFHSFASSIIAENPDYFLMRGESRIITDLERFQLIEEILDIEEHEIDILRPQGNPHFYLNYIIKTIQDLKREGLTAAKYRKLIGDVIPDIKEKAKEKKDLHKQLELAIVYEYYEKELKSRGLYDFEDLINFVNKKFGEQDDLLRSYQERFQYILVDEFQDTNSAQYNLVRSLANYWGEESDVFVVGDDEQSIYRFQGASIENLLNFKSDFPKTKIVTLTDNYRSTQAILDSSRKLINHNKVSIIKHFPQVNKKLKSNVKGLPRRQAGSKSKLYFCNFSSNLTESYFVAKKVKELIENGEDPNEIAVIYRNNSDSHELAKIFSKLQILYNLEGGEDVLKDPDVNKFIYLLAVVEKSKYAEENLDFFNILSYPFLNFDYVENLRLARLAAEKGRNMQDVILQKDFVEMARKKNLENPKVYKNFMDKIAHWQSVDAKNTFNTTFEIILEESGYLNFLLKKADSIESISKINSLFREVQSWVRVDPDFKLKKFMQTIDLMHKNNLRILETDFDINSNTVTLCTAHKSKGLEFKHVFIYSFYDKKWGNNRNYELIRLPEGILNTSLNADSRKVLRGALQKEQNEDERRLFYVAMTRAKENVYITNSFVYYNDWGQKKVEVSMFFHELPKESIQVLNTEEIETKEFIKQAIHLQVMSPETPKVSAREVELLKNLVEKYSLSVTGLNTYLTCPYKFKLNTLLKTPRAKSPYLTFGSAVHGAMEFLYKRYKETGEVPKYEYLEKKYISSLKKEILSRKQRARLVRKGKRILRAYYANYHEDFKKPEYLERLFGYGFGKIFLEDVPLVGKVDRIELLKEQGSSKYVKIVDYKTGKPKSRNEIEGNTKNSSGDYKRQLVFYKILCDLDRTFRYKAEEYELDFIEPNERGRFKREVYKISKREVDAIKKVILETMKKIRDLEFPRTTDYINCEKCDYKKHCWPDGIPKQKYTQVGLGLTT